MRIASSFASALIAQTALLTGAVSAGAVKVHPGNLAGWLPGILGAGSYEFVLGPGTPPAGSGSLRLRGGPSAENDVAQVTTTNHSGTRLADLTLLRFRLWVTAHPNNPNYTGAFGIGVDHDGVGSVVDEIVVFEAIWNGYAQQSGIWQSWDVLGATVLWSFPRGGPPPYGTTFTIAEFLEDHPDAEIVSFGYAAGGGPASIENFDGSLDLVEFAAGGDTTSYDFEPLEVFTDDFESGNTTAWSSTVSPP